MKWVLVTLAICVNGRCSDHTKQMRADQARRAVPILRSLGSIEFRGAVDNITVRVK